MFSHTSRRIVTLFASAYVLSFIDRQILALLIEPVKADLHLTDFQFALLNGFAFALLYSLLGLPLAALSDRYRRPPIIVTGIVVWSLATIGCGFSQNFWQLFLCRMVVGIGEAALVPAVYSYLADVVPAERLGRTLALFSLGSFIGAGLAFLFGGTLIAALHTMPHGEALAPWKLCFIAVGVPGVPLACLIGLTVREIPARHVRAMVAGRGAAVKYFMKYPAFFLMHFVGYALTAVTLFAILGWTPALLGRDRHLSHQATGMIMGCIIIICGVGGAYGSGRLIDFLAKQGFRDAPVRVGMLSPVLTPVFFLGSIFLPGNALCIICMALAFVFAAFPMAPSAVTLQQVVPRNLRARFSSVLLLCNALIGLSGGSMLIGYLDDHIFTHTSGVRLSLAVVIGGASVLAAALIVMSGLFLEGPLAAATAADRGDSHSPLLQREKM